VAITFPADRTVFALLVKPISDGRHPRRRVTVHMFPSINKIRITDRYCSFSVISKIRGHARFHTRSKQNCDCDSVEMLTATVYENVLDDSESLLRYWHHRAVRYLSDRKRRTRSFRVDRRTGPGGILADVVTLVTVYVSGNIAEYVGGTVNIDKDAGCPNIRAEDAKRVYSSPVIITIIRGDGRRINENRSKFRRINSGV